MVKTAGLVESYTNWSGATLVDKDGQVNHRPNSAALAAAVAREVADIRMLLPAANISKIRLDIRDAELIAGIKAILSESELCRVEFGDGTHG